MDDCLACGHPSDAHDDEGPGAPPGACLVLGCPCRAFDDGFAEDDDDDDDEEILADVDDLVIDDEDETDAWPQPGLR